MRTEHDYQLAMANRDIVEGEQRVRNQRALSQGLGADADTVALTS
jgi:hypothetical protein